MQKHVICNYVKTRFYSSQTLIHENKKLTNYAKENIFS